MVAGGVDIVYPPENAAPNQGISEKRAIISDMPPGFQPRSKDTRRRNRVISGIALAVLVIEAAKRSGTFVTARLAGEQGREVFAVPGHPLDPHAEGTNGLLKNGATLVTTPDDIIEAGVPLSGLSPDVAFAEQYPIGPWQPPPPAPPPCAARTRPRPRAGSARPGPSRYRRPHACHRPRHTHSQCRAYGIGSRRPHRPSRRWLISRAE